MEEGFRETLLSSSCVERALLWLLSGSRPRLEIPAWVLNWLAKDAGSDGAREDLNFDFSSAVVVKLDIRIRYGECFDMELLTGTIFVLLMPDYQLGDWVLGWSLFRTKSFILRTGPNEQRRRMGEATWLNQQSPHVPSRFALKLNPVDEMVIVYAGRSDFMVTRSRRMGIAVGTGAFFFDRSGTLQYSRVSKPRCEFCRSEGRTCLCSGAIYWSSFRSIPQAFSSWGSWLQRQKRIEETVPNAVHDLTVDENHPLALEILRFIFRETEQFQELTRFILDDVVKLNPTTDIRIGLVQCHHHLNKNISCETCHDMNKEGEESKELQGCTSSVKKADCDDVDETSNTYPSTTNDVLEHEQPSVDVSTSNYSQSHPQNTETSEVESRNVQVTSCSVTNRSPEYSDKPKNTKNPLPLTLYSTIGEPIHGSELASMETSRSNRSNEVVPPNLSESNSNDDLQNALAKENEQSHEVETVNDVPDASAKESLTCPTCSRTFSRWTNLKRHIDAVHSSTTELSCDFCERKFSRLDNLRRHTLMVHKPTSSSRWLCIQCGRQLASKQNLLNHIRIFHSRDSTEKPSGGGLGT